MSIILLWLLYISPVLLIICMVVFRYSFTLQQAGIIASIFTIIPAMFKLLQIKCKVRTEGNQAIIDLQNFFMRRNHKNIADWFRRHQYKNERYFNESIYIIAILSFFSGQLMQLIATFIYP